jgi:predicted polyphosphate/ATP-dependent NAD kinase
MKTLGLIVNPVAGMGGAVGLKGTDGKAILRKAVSLGAKPVAPIRAEQFLTYLKPASNKIRLITAAGTMGENEALKAGFECETIWEAKRETSSRDTKAAAENMMDSKVDLLIFCGGDGTARDMMDIVNIKIPVLGLPTGVKMHSAVFACNPESAVNITMQFLLGGLPLKEAEVMDVDEEAYRQGRLSAKIYGYMLIPYEPEFVQGAKLASPETENELRNQAAIAVYVIDKVLEPDVTFILGPGTTTRTITDLLNEKKTLLGVDLLCNKKIVARDVNESKILNLIKGKCAKIIVTPIGGQGFVFGRGNQQISPTVIRQVGLDNLVIIATKGKLRSLGKLRVDTGDPLLDKSLKGQVKVIVDYSEEHIMRLN